MDRKRPREDDEAGDTGGEISMSIEETNKLRISLGLKPLEVGGSKKEDDSARRHQEEQRKKRAKEERAQRFKDKQERKRQNAEDDFLAVKTLGEADDVDDTLAWVEKSRVAEVAKRAEEKYAAREAAQQQQKKQQRAGSDDDEDDEDGGYSAADLAGLKVRHGIDDLHEGETMVLTLADQQLLDERGRTLRDDVDDELVNTLKAEDKARQKAREAAAPKAKPLWEEDGKRRGLLDKYDEEEADAVVQLGEGGVLPAAQREEMKRRLAEGGKLLDSAAVGVLGLPGANGAIGVVNGVSSGDYYTAQDATAAPASFKKKKKKERKLRAKSAEPEGEEGTAALIEQLEAAQQQEEAGGAELGSRVSRATARERAEAQLRQEAAEKRARFEAAVAKGNWASQALKQQQAPLQAELVVGDEDDADMELQESLARARRLAAQKQPHVKEEDMDTDEKDQGAGPINTLEAIAESAAKRREAEEAKLKDELAAATKLGKDRVVNDTIEFVRNIQAAPIPAAGPVALGAASVAAGVASRAGPVAKKEEEKDDYMDLDEEDLKESAPGGGWSTAPAHAADAVGRWVSAQNDKMEDEDEAGTSVRAGQHKAKDEEASGSGNESEDDGNVVREKALGRGLASVLGLLKERGDLQTEKQLQWAGRTNDRSKNALQGLIGDVYAGGGHSEAHAQRIEAALTIKDEFGRVMTPKERFRQLCYDFHGKRPSKNKEEKRVAKAKEEIARRHNATSEVAQGQEVEGLQKVTEKVAQPFVVLQGKGAMETLKTLQGSSAMPPPPPKGKAGKERQKSAAPPPPGNLTPLLGDKKVEAMLSMNKPGSRLAPPPSGPPRQP